jgi:GT2 family glycosyltransferase
MVEEEFPQIHLIVSRENKGFARANNIGLRAATGEYVLLLNSDTRVLGDALEILIDFLDNHGEAAVVSARVVYPDMSDQGVARTFPTPLNAFFGRRSILTRLFPNNGYAKKYMISRSHMLKEPFEVDWVSGACLMVRRSVIEEVGFLDEQFFMYWEDADLCYRIKQKGWKVVCVPDAVVIHYEGKSAQRKQSNGLIMEFNKSAYRYYRKHHVKSFFEFMNIMAICGLTLRTIVLLASSKLKRKASPGYDENEQKVDIL